MEPDFHRKLGTDCAISTSRIYLEDVTRRAEEVMIEEDLPKALCLMSVRKVLSAFESRKTVSSRAGASEQRQVV